MNVYFHNWDESALECIALKACPAMQCLLLKKPRVKSKTKEHVACLVGRMILWTEGEIDRLISEGRCIEKHLSSIVTEGVEMEKIARGFNRLMLQGKTRQAVRLISSVSKGGLFNVGTLIAIGEDENGDVQMKTAREVQIDKHPQGKIGEQTIPSLMEILSAASLFSTVIFLTPNLAIHRMNGSLQTETL